LKTVGLILIFAACTFFGFSVSRKKREAIEYTGALILLIEYMRLQIRDYRSELGEIYSSYKNDFLSRIGFIDHLRSSGFGVALQNTYREFGIDDDLYRTLSAFSESLGRSDAQTQTDMCDRIIERLNECKNARQESYANEKKLYSALGILAGALIVIILL